MRCSAPERQALQSSQRRPLPCASANPRWTRSGLPIKLRQERSRWLTEASGLNSPINDVHGLSDEANRVYAYLASVTLRLGSSHSRVHTIAKVAGVSEYKARKAISELERRRLLSHRRRNTWHSRGAHAYNVERVTDR